MTQQSSFVSFPGLWIPITCAAAGAAAGTACASDRRPGSGGQHPRPHRPIDHHRYARRRHGEITDACDTGRAPVRIDPPSAAKPAPPDRREEWAATQSCCQDVRASTRGASVSEAPPRPAARRVVLDTVARATVALLVMIGGAAALELYAQTSVLSPNPRKLCIFLFLWCFLAAAPPARD